MKLSHYEWDPEKDLIAQGGFAEVFKARDLFTSNRLVALKIYKEGVSKGTTGGHTIQRKYSLEKEFDRIDGLSHTNLIKFFGLEYLEHKDHMSRTSNYPVLIMEYAGEGTLKDLSPEKCSSAEIIRIIKEIIKGTSYLHSQGIIHRDLKPGNILFTKDRRGRLVPKITDFGISRDIIDDKTVEMSMTEGLGTPHYMAPEQFYKRKFGLNCEVSNRTDIWAIGVLIYKLLTGKLPFGNDSKDYETIRDEIVDKEVDLKEVPKNFKQIIKACLQKKAIDRPETATALLHDLNKNIGGAPIEIPHIVKESEVDEEKTVVQKSSKKVPQKVSRKRSHKYVIIVTLLLLTLICGGVFGFNWYEKNKIEDLLAEAWDSYTNGRTKEAYEYYLKASEYESGKAYHFLSVMNRNGIGVKRDYKKAEEYASNAVNEDYDLAAYNLGEILIKGLGKPIDSIVAKRYFKMAFNYAKNSDHNYDLESKYILGYLYRFGLGTEKDIPKAKEYLTYASVQDHPLAILQLSEVLRFDLESSEKDCTKAKILLENEIFLNVIPTFSYSLGNLFYYGCEEIEHDYKKAFEYFSLAAQQDLPAAKDMLGDMYLNGFGVKADEEEALWYYRQSAEAGISNSFTNLGYLYSKRKNYTEAIFWNRKAANNGNSVGQSNLGNLFENGQGTEKKLDSALYWYKKSANNNYATAQYNLGRFYENGIATDKNLTEAKKWYLKSAEQDYYFAQFRLGYLLHLSKNYKEALYWFKKAAENGDSTSMHNVGYYYSNGLGVMQNSTEAKKWYQKACSGGYKESCKLI